MKISTLFLLVTIMAFSAVPESGVSEALARDRAASISSLRYNLFFLIPSQRKEPLRGSAGLQFVLKQPREVVVDFGQPRDRVSRIIVNRVEGVAVAFVNGHIVIPAAATKAGENVVSIEFLPGDDALNRSDDFLYTLFVPARARLAFPCFDQPDLKARFRLRVGAPLGWTVVANGAAQPGTLENNVTEFAETQPLSTYLFAFAAGKFQVETAERNGRTFRMFIARPTRPRWRAIATRFSICTPSALAWLEDYTGIKYPWGKFDFVLIPSFQFGGMEHPGAILL